MTDKPGTPPLSDDEPGADTVEMETVKLLPRWWVFFEERIILNLATILMCAAMGVMFYEAMSRSLFAESYWWAEELVRFLVVWSVMMGLGVATRHHHFIRMDLLLDMLPPWARMASSWLNCLIGLGFSGILIYAGIVEVRHMAYIGMMTDSNLDLPLWFVRMATPIGGTLFALHFIGSMYALTRGVDPNSKIVS
ncbi:TRAP transporter small permease [Pontivivens nitratireducens]|uniref:TRAP transporter small permease n=1 Tax=Pontivivens nitratireducens TaxID=2758038 RepID=UPI00163B3EAE|nr:TRAP transporter small permease [Pontibrevibacter nitratireducens]